MTEAAHAGERRVGRERGGGPCRGTHTGALADVWALRNFGVRESSSDPHSAAVCAPPPHPTPLYRGCVLPAFWCIRWKTTWLGSALIGTSMCSFQVSSVPAAHRVFDRCAPSRFVVASDILAVPLGRLAVWAVPLGADGRCKPRKKRPRLSSCLASRNARASKREVAALLAEDCRWAHSRQQQRAPLTRSSM